jgi:hypothetical protein
VTDGSVIHQEWPHYRLFGATVASDFVFANRLPTASPPADVAFTCQPSPLDIDGAPRALYAPPDAGRGLSLYRAGDWIVIRRALQHDYYLHAGSILCHCGAPIHRGYLVELGLLGAVLAIWNELQGCLALHASVLVIDGHAIGILGGHGQGKTTVAATLMTMGAELLSDDLLIIRSDAGGVMAQPGYPQMRMWPDQVRRFVGDRTEWPLVHPDYTKRRVVVGPAGFGCFCSHPKPLAALYVLARGSQVAMTAFDEATALVMLLRHSFLPEVGLALLDQTPRLARLAELTALLPVRQLGVPEDVEKVVGACRMLLSDLAQVTGGSIR